MLGSVQVHLFTNHYFLTDMHVGSCLTYWPTAQEQSNYMNYSIYVELMNVLYCTVLYCTVTRKFSILCTDSEVFQSPFMSYTCCYHTIILYASSKLCSSFFYRSVDAWNHLPSNIKLLTSLYSLNQQSNFLIYPLF